ncbi:helix-turn-helix transcriptional regulator [Halomonas sp. M4R1S46]|uniref:helix-turn-helix transcriptional regulator n=1 Tax=Halomonas sp. M4R1S46 TaxID=2982692 RepID=UPI00398E5BBE
MKEFLTDREVAQWAGLGRTTIWRLVGQGRFPRPVKPAPGATRWRRKDLDRWAASLSEEDRA